MLSLGIILMRNGRLQYHGNAAIPGMDGQHRRAGEAETCDIVEPRCDRRAIFTIPISENPWSSGSSDFSVARKRLVGAQGSPTECGAEISSSGWVKCPKA